MLTVYRNTPPYLQQLELGSPGQGGREQPINTLVVFLLSMELVLAFPDGGGNVLPYAVLYDASNLPIIAARKHPPMGCLL